MKLLIFRGTLNLLSEFFMELKFTEAQENLTSPPCRRNYNRICGRRPIGDSYLLLYTIDDAG